MGYLKCGWCYALFIYSHEYNTNSAEDSSDMN